MSEHEVRSRLEPYHQCLIDSVLTGWGRWTSEFAPRLPLRSRRTRPVVVHDLILEHATARLEDMPGVTVIRRRGRCLISLGGDLLLRFKQLDADFQPRNYPTLTSLQFDAQEPLRLPGIPDACRVTIGYTPNEFGFEISGIYVTMTGPKPWRYDLLESHQGTALPLPHIGKAATSKPVAPNRRRVSVKSGETNHGERATSRTK